MEKSCFCFQFLSLQHLQPWCFNSCGLHSGTCLRRSCHLKSTPLTHPSPLHPHFTIGVCIYATHNLLRLSPFSMGKEPNRLHRDQFTLFRDQKPNRGLAAQQQPGNWPAPTLAHQVCMGGTNNVLGAKHTKGRKACHVQKEAVLFIWQYFGLLDQEKKFFTVFSQCKVFFPHWENGQIKWEKLKRKLLGKETFFLIGHCLKAVHKSPHMETRFFSPRRARTLLPEWS